MRKNRILAFLMAAVIAFNGAYLSPVKVYETITVEAAEYGTEYLTGVNLDLYNELKSIVSDIAAGNVSSTSVTINLEYTYSELGVNTYEEAVRYISSTLTPTSVMSYLIYDCPYEMYWMDKTQDMPMDVGSSRTRDGITVRVVLKLPVSTDYQGESEYTVDTEKTALAGTAIANAQSIVDKYADELDLDKIAAYKDEICALVTYEEDYEDADYGDIWQLIWVFDGDDSTNVVCEGYSKAFQYLCDISEFEADVECYTVTGYTSNGVTIGSHMWNLIRIDGTTYMVDVTNSETDSLGETGDLFMVSDEDAISYNSYGYVVSASGYRITYTYDTVTLGLYSASVLTLGATMLGDVNSDGSIDYLDAMTVLRYDAELIELGDDELEAGDVNNDGEVNSLDAILILRYDAGLITSF